MAFVQRGGSRGGSRGGTYNFFFPHNISPNDKYISQSFKLFKYSNVQKYKLRSNNKFAKEITKEIMKDTTLKFNFIYPSLFLYSELRIN